MFCVRKQVKLLDLDLCASFLELGGDLFGFVLGDAFLEVLRSAVDEFLGFLQAQAGQSTDDLDDSDLVGASGLQNDVELGLLFLSSSSAWTSSASSRTVRVLTSSIIAVIFSDAIVVTSSKLFQSI